MHQVVTGIIRDLSPKRLGLFISKDIHYRFIIWLLHYQNKNMIFDFENQVINRHPTQVKLIKDHVLKAADKIPKPKVFIFNISSNGWLEFNNLISCNKPYLCYPAPYAELCSPFLDCF